jgi:hypothetical protein
MERGNISAAAGFGMKKGQQVTSLVLLSCSLVLALADLLADAVAVDFAFLHSHMAML